MALHITPSKIELSQKSTRKSGPISGPISRVIGWQAAAGLAALLLLVIIAAPEAGAFSISERARELRLKVIEYLRVVKPMVYNFPCSPFPQCYQELREGQGGQEAAIEEAGHVKEYSQIKELYREGLFYYFEGGYADAYNRFLVSQVRMDALFENLSSFYLDRGSRMLGSAVAARNSDDPLDSSVLDISLDYSRGSQKRIDFSRPRETPHYERLYHPKEYHWAQNSYRIEANVQKGYERIAQARNAREMALRIERLVPEGQEPTPYQRERRIELYLHSIRASRLAKFNAAFIYQLKYPYENYALQNPFGNSEKGRYEAAAVPVIENVRMKWIENPYLIPKKLEPVMDLRIPENFRRDISDARNQIYRDEIDKFVRLKYSKNKPASYELVEGELPASAASPAPAPSTASPPASPAPPPPASATPPSSGQ